MTTLFLHKALSLYISKELSGEQKFVGNLKETRFAELIQHTLPNLLEIHANYIRENII